MDNTSIFSEKKFKQLILAVLALLALFLLAKSINEFSHVGERGQFAQQDAITVSGKGEVFAVPDIATFTFSINEEGKDVSEAQKKSAAKNNVAMKYLKDNGIDEKDIKTEGYNANPKYDYSQIVCIKYPCPSNTPKLIGYEVSETISVKVRNVEKAGDILSGIGSTGVSNISGLSFTVDNEETIRAEARAKAIADAKEKAKVLTKALGVKIDGVVSFYEDNNVNMPMYAMDSKAMGIGGGEASPVSEIAKGQNKITVNVNVTYRIK
jgi:uncharacterized protein